MTYKPLPEELTIRESTIEGLGLFTTKDVPKGHVFGISHVQDKKFPDGFIRTPLGGFFNHSTSPNSLTYREGRYVFLKTSKVVKAGEEITARYWLYNITSGA